MLFDSELERSKSNRTIFQRSNPVTQEIQTTGWGLIGASTIAGEHMVRAIRAQAGHEIVAVASGSLERARVFAAGHGIEKVYGSVSALLADPKVRVVYVSSTNERHHQQVVAAAAAGKHVLCEKPLALNLQDAEAMVQACRDAGVVLATNHHLRNAATHRKIRDLIRGGAIGTPLFARVFHAVHLPASLQGWRIDRPEAGGGVILDISVHDADTLRFILDAEPVEAVGLAQSTPMARQGLEDGVMAVLRFDNGLLAQLHDAFTVGHAGTGIEIHGTSGSIFGRDVMTQKPIGSVWLRDAQGERECPVEHADLYAQGVQAFCRALETGSEPAATAQDGLRSLAVALAVAESCRTGRSIRL